MVVHALMSCKCPTWAWNTRYGWTFPRARVATHQTALDFTWRTLHSRVTDMWITQKKNVVSISDILGDVTARRSHQWSIVNPTPIFSCAAVPEHGNVRAETQKCATTHIKRVVLATNVCNHLNDKRKSTNISRKSWSYGHKLWSQNSKKKNLFIRSCLALEGQCGVVWIENDLSSLCVNEYNSFEKTASIEARPKKRTVHGHGNLGFLILDKTKIGQDIEKCGKLFIHQWFGLINRTWNLSSTECLPFP